MHCPLASTSVLSDLELPKQYQAGVSLWQVTLLPDHAIPLKCLPDIFAVPVMDSATACSFPSI
jgi:hypothetical protein